MTVRLEHANLSVRNIDATIRFLQTAFPDFRIRHDGTDPDGTRWAHIGTDDTYIALTKVTAEPETRWVPYEGLPGVNHLAYEVSDVDSLRLRLSEAGFTDSTVTNIHPHRKRVYFNDPDGNDWEFIEYHSSDPRERHDYETSDKPPVAE